ncbi:MAG: phytanoyl-CoA dioxygenase family protein [Pseudomonadota bacterium]
MTLADDVGDREPLREERAPAFQMLSLEAIKAELNRPYPLCEAERSAFLRNGSIKLKNVVSPDAALTLRAEQKALLERAHSARLDAVGDGRFLSLEMVWTENPLVRAFVLSPRIAGIAAELLQVPAVRLYHDNILSKEPAGGRTPWHFDDHHFPLATHNVATAWLPCQAIPPWMGPLAFARPIEAWKLVKDVPFNTRDTSYDREVAARFQENEVVVDDAPFDLGDVSFHHNLSFHTAAANRSTLSRIVLANTYYEDGARVIDDPTMVSGDWRKFIPDTEPGEPAASPLNPICGRADL